MARGASLVKPDSRRQRDQHPDPLGNSENNLQDRDSGKVTVHCAPFWKMRGQSFDLFNLRRAQYGSPASPWLLQTRCQLTPPNCISPTGRPRLPGTEIGTTPLAGDWRRKLKARLNARPAHRPRLWIWLEYRKTAPGWSFADQPALKSTFFEGANQVVIAVKPVAGVLVSLARRLHHFSGTDAILIMEQCHGQRTGAARSLE